MPRIRLATVIATAVGYVSLSWEIAWFRAFAFATGGPATVFGMLLAAFLAGTACGSLLATRIRDRAAFDDDASIHLLGWLLALAAALSFAVVPALARIVVVSHWGLALPIVFAATAAYGATLPILAGVAVQPDESVGAGVSYLYAGNILGCIAGTLVTGLFLFDVLSLRQLAVCLATAGQILSLILLWQGVDSRRRIAAILLTVLYASTAPLLFDSLFERMQWRGSFKQGEHFERTVENRSGIIAVTTGKEVYGGGAYDGALSTDFVNDVNGILRAYAVSGFHPAPRKVLMIGLSGGAWAQVIANLPGVEKVTVVEINKGYIGLIHDYPQVASILTNPKVEIIIDDGRRWLARNPDRRFDVIVTNTTFHWRANVTNLLSVEHLRLCRDHLNRGGVLYYNTTASDDALVTGMRFFPYGFRFHAFAVASADPIRWDGERFRGSVIAMSIDGHRVVNPDEPADRAVLNRAEFPSPAMLESRESVLRRLRTALTVTDDNMVTEWGKSLIFRIRKTSLGRL